MQDTASSTTYLGDERTLPPAHPLSSPFGFRVWVNREGERPTACVTFGMPGGGLSVAVWTTPEALSIIVEECQKALAREPSSTRLLAERLHDEAQDWKAPA